MGERQRPPVVVDARHAQGAAILRRRDVRGGKVRGGIVVVVVVTRVCVGHDRPAPDIVGVGEMVAAGIGVSSRTGIGALPVAVSAAHVVSRFVAHGVAAVDRVDVTHVASVVHAVEEFEGLAGIAGILESDAGGVAARTVDEERHRVGAALVPQLREFRERAFAGTHAQQQFIVDRRPRTVYLHDADQAIAELVVESRIGKHRVHLVDGVVGEIVNAVEFKLHALRLRSLVEGDEDIDDALLRGEGEGTGIGQTQFGRRGFLS